MPISSPHAYDRAGISGILQSPSLQLRDLFRVSREEQSFQAYSLPESLYNQDRLSLSLCQVIKIIGSKSYIHHCRWMGLSVNW